MYGVELEVVSLRLDTHPHQGDPHGERECCFEGVRTLVDMG